MVGIFVPQKTVSASNLGRCLFFFPERFFVVVVVCLFPIDKWYFLARTTIGILGRTSLVYGFLLHWRMFSILGPGPLNTKIINPSHQNHWSVPLPQHFQMFPGSRFSSLLWKMQSFFFFPALLFLLERKRSKSRLQLRSEVLRTGNKMLILVIIQCHII